MNLECFLEKKLHGHFQTQFLSYFVSQREAAVLSHIILSSGLGAIIVKIFECGWFTMDQTNLVPLQYLYKAIQPVIFSFTDHFI